MEEFSAAESTVAFGEDELGGVGLHWMTDDWTDVGLGSSTFHNGADAGSNCVVMMNAHVQAAVVLLSNFYGDEAIGWTPDNIGWAAPYKCCLLYTSPSPRDRTRSRMPSSA